MKMPDLEIQANLHVKNIEKIGSLHQIIGAYRFLDPYYRSFIGI